MNTLINCIYTITNWTKTWWNIKQEFSMVFIIGCIVASLLLAQWYTTWSGSHALSRKPSGRRKTKQTRESSNSVWTPLKGSLNFSNRGTYTRSETKKRVYVGDIMWVGLFFICFKWLYEQNFGVSTRWKISIEASGCCCISSSAGMRKGADGGHTDCELRMKRKQDSLISL